MIDLLNEISEQEKNSMVKGSCLCGGIEYEVELVPGKIFNCHCSECRKSHGSAFATQAFAVGDTLKFTKGEDLLSEFEEGHCKRAFCSKCGSRLMNYAPDKSFYLSVALSSLDTNIEHGPVAHAYVSDKANWHNPSIDIPSFNEVPEGAID